jgi:hypothetical protein
MCDTLLFDGYGEKRPQLRLVPVWHSYAAAFICRGAESSCRLNQGLQRLPKIQSPHALPSTHPQYPSLCKGQHPLVTRDAVCLARVNRIGRRVRAKASAAATILVPGCYALQGIKVSVNATYDSGKRCLHNASYPERLHELRLTSMRKHSAIVFAHSFISM